MKKMNAAFVLVIGILIVIVHPGVEAIGINYGFNGDNLPAPAEAITLLKSRGISKIRIFEPKPDVLEALQGSGISVILGTRNEDLQSIASDPSAATAWVETNVVPYASSFQFTCISAGNEVVPGELAQYVPGAMENLHAALTSASLAIPVSTAVSMEVIGQSFPPSEGSFSTDSIDVMTQIISFLASKQSPLLLNAYTWFPRLSDQTNVPLDYALLLDSASPVADNLRTYHNLFDAMVDSVYSAVEKAGGPDVRIIVTETGWPSGGSAEATIENAQTYNSNLIKHVMSGEGTPARPDKAIEAYIFALFNEDLKAQGVEQNWGIYNPDMTEVYHLEF